MNGGVRGVRRGVYFIQGGVGRVKNVDCPRIRPFVMDAADLEREARPTATQKNVMAPISRRTPKKREE